MLKRYCSISEDQVEENLTSTSSSVTDATIDSLIDNMYDDTTNDGFSLGVPCPLLKRFETWKDVKMGNAIK